MGEHRQQEGDGPRKTEEIRDLWDVAFGVARRKRLSIQDAEDVAVESVVAAWKAPKFRELEHSERRGYVYVTAKRKASQRLQQARGSEPSDVDPTIPAPASEFDPALHVALHQALADIEPQLVLVLQRYYGEGETESEIAEALDYSRGTVNRYRHLALSRLREEFDVPEMSPPPSMPTEAPADDSAHLPSGTVNTVPAKDVG